MATAYEQMNAMVDFSEAIAAGPYYYYQGPGRCDPLNSGYADCSGQVVASYRHIGFDMVCTGSFQLAIWAHQEHRGISYDQARSTRGALCWIGINEGQGGVPGRDPGHIGWSLGNGLTCEARNSRVGIVIADFDWRGWDYFALPPFLNYSAVVEPEQPEKPEPPKRKRKMNFFYTVPDHPTKEHRSAIWMSDGYLAKHVSPKELKELQFIAGSQGLPTHIGQISYATHKGMQVIA